MNNEINNNQYDEELAQAIELANTARNAGITPSDAYNMMDEDIFEGYEMWRPVPDFDGFEASNLGRVKVNGRIRKGTIASNGYVRQVFRMPGGVRKHLYFHRLVLLAFYGSSDYECDHINANKMDNFIDNLEFVSRQENIDRASKYYGQYADRPVLVMNASNFEFVSLEKNVRMAGRHNHVPATFVLGAAEGVRSKEHGGLIFTFAPESFNLMLPSSSSSKKRKSKKNDDNDKIA